MERATFAAAIAARTRQIREELEPKVRAAVAANPLMDAELAVAVNVAQNVLKDVLTVTMDAACPQPPAFFGELATRVACYVLTAMHPDDQEQAALGVRRALLDKLADMQATGNVLTGDWR